jgi:uncharacterized protein YukE
MTELISSARLDEAAGDLREAAHRLGAAVRRLDREAGSLRWRGRGADRFRSVWRHRQVTLERTVEELRRAAGACTAAAEDVREERRDLARLERAYRDLEAAGVLPSPRPAPPPPGDTAWREFFRQAVAGLA